MDVFIGFYLLHFTGNCADCDGGIVRGKEVKKHPILALFKAWVGCWKISFSESTSQRVFKNIGQTGGKHPNTERRIASTYAFGSYRLECKPEI
jgi:hypothetical protein